ncbi:ABC transporter substrate-binding protein [Nonomuraea sp. NBC_01738]|uniref:ABC transporter substrate-binding protein n=1 Tax=Nonomuraea sp. NBC_01738 TaxID=2976003 RepID=UPI002E15207E|nr:ABC transporter substrate-binding protein [Nonomuraea sp. NBC_01738]
MRLALLGLATLLAVAGCGGAATQSAPDDSTVKVGAIISQTGVYSALGDDMETAMRLYLDEHGGKLGGKAAKLVVADDAGTPETGQQKARQLTLQDQVDVITGLIASPVAVAVAKEAGTQKTPVVIANAGADALGGPGVFRVSYTNYMHGYAAGRYAAEKYGKEGAVLMGADYSAGTETLKGFAEGYAKGGGAAPIKQILTPFGKTQNFQPYLSQIPAEAKFLYVFYAGGEAITFAKNFKQFGYDTKVKLLTCQNITDEDVLQAIGADAEGITSVGLYSPALDNPENTAFVAKWKAKTGKNPSVVALQSWDAMSLIDKAAGQPGSLTDALGKAGDITSPRGTFKLDDKHNPVQNWYAREYSAGVNKVVATIAPEAS